MTPTDAKKRLVIVGATGLVGGYALRSALDHPAVGTVTAIGRKPTGLSHPKLNEVLHQDFADCSALAGPLSSQDAAVFCLGVYTGAVPDAELHRITVDYTIEFARVLRGSSPNATFGRVDSSVDHKASVQISHNADVASKIDPTLDLKASNQTEEIDVPTPKFGGAAGAILRTRAAEVNQQAENQEPLDTLTSRSDVRLSSTAPAATAVSPRARRTCRARGAPARAGRGTLRAVIASSSSPKELPGIDFLVIADG